MHGVRERGRGVEGGSDTREDPNSSCKTKVGISPATKRDSDMHGAKMNGNHMGLGSLPSAQDGCHRADCLQRPPGYNPGEVAHPLCSFTFWCPHWEKVMVTKLPGGRSDMRRIKVLQRKEVEGLGKAPPHAYQGSLLAFDAARGGGGGRTSQEDVTEEDQATETKISNKVRQGNPLWVQLCLHLRAQREAQLLWGRWV